MASRPASSFCWVILVVEGTEYVQAFQDFSIAMYISNPSIIEFSIQNGNFCSVVNKCLGNPIFVKFDNDDFK